MFVAFPKRKPRRKSSRSKPSIENRVRHLVDQVPYRVTGVVHVSGQTEASPEHESFLERDAIMLLAMCCDVTAIRSQPERVEYSDPDGVVRRYTPDFAVDVASRGTVRLEVKPIRNLLSERILPGMENLARHFIAIGQRFDVLTDDAIGIQPRLNNVRRLRSFRRHAITDGAPERIGKVLKSGPRTIRDLISECGDVATWADALALVSWHELSIDWSLPLTSDSKVSIPDAPLPRLSYEQIVCSGRFRPLVEELVLGNRPSDRVLLAAAIHRDRSVPLSDAFGVVGGIPARALYVGRALDRPTQEHDDE